MADNGEPSRDFDPKHRVIGAVILVALAVILLPMILHETPPSQPDEQLHEIPLPDKKIFVSPVSQPPEAEKSAALAPPPSKPEPSPAPEKPAPEALPPKPPEPAAVTKTAPAGTPAAAPKAAPDAGARDKPAPPPVQKGWIVQVGAFTRQDNAQKLRDRLRQQGFAAEFEQITVDKGALVRVWVGPFHDKAEAKAAQVRLEREHNLKGVVIAHPSRHSARKP